ncbi:NAD(P)H-dependent oxidoreductase [Enterococcus faecium]|uniref:NAD(P)H-dependent oxidoreductase n=1 Tax=Enterococcus faecium TaxID=1352 RepID=UPI000A350F4C|nr:NAD(P)H-dependent oxidoreductase [Enterococcus faecium]OTN91540.1 hypothetical protein A5809_000905 [Enterococcus faecium]
MRTRIFIFHPNLNHESKVNRVLANAARNAGIDVRDMYALYPNFKINVSVEQEILEKTDRIVLQFPMYWYNSPALMKEWLDRVLVYGWAYGSQGTALQGKELLLAVTQGAHDSDYRVNGRFHVTTEELMKPFMTIQYHTGLKFLPTFSLANAMHLSNEDLQKAGQHYVERLLDNPKEKK